MSNYSVMTDHGDGIDFDIVEADSAPQAQIPAEKIWNERGYHEVWFTIVKIEES